MSKPYVLYLANQPQSLHERFEDAFDAYCMSPKKRGLNIRNTERADVDDNGLTEEERSRIERADAAPQIIDLFEALKRSLEKL